MRPFYRGNGHQDALGNLKTSRISQCALGGGAYSMLAPQALVELAVGSSQARAYLWSDDNHGCLKKNIQSRNCSRSQALVLASSSKVCGISRMLSASSFARDLTTPKGHAHHLLSFPNARAACPAAVTGPSAICSTGICSRAHGSGELDMSYR